MKKSAPVMKQHVKDSTHRAPAGLSVEGLEGRLNLSTLARSYNYFAVDVPNKGMYDVTIRSNVLSTKNTVQSIALDAQDGDLPVWVQHTEKLGSRSLHKNTTALQLTAGRHVLKIDTTTNQITDTLVKADPATSPQVTSTADSESNIVSAFPTYAAFPNFPHSICLGQNENGDMSITWTDDSNVETGYKIERRTGDSSDWTQIGAVGANVTEFVDSDVLDGVKYAYRVKATNAYGDSPASLLVQKVSSFTKAPVPSTDTDVPTSPAVPENGPTPAPADGTNNVPAPVPVTVTLPSAPSALSVIESGASQLTLRWTDNAANESGFKVERQSAGGSWTQIGTVDAGVTTYADSSVVMGTTYTYRVRATNSAGDSAYTNTATPSAGVVLTPGTGFSGPVTQPAAIGTGAHKDAVAIARWDVVPNQQFSGNFNVGVVAFHINGIDHVDFSVNGGDWLSVSQPTMDAQTGVVEYFATLRASDFADGKLEVRAVAYPKVGTPRALEGLTLFANAGGSLTQKVYISPTGSDQTGDGTAAHPWGSMLGASWASQPGAIVYMLPGTYQMSERTIGFRNDGGQWLTYQPAPGVTRDQVTVSIKNTDSMRAGLVKFENIRLDMTAGVSITRVSGVWLDNVEMYSTLAVQSPVSLLSADQAGKIYVTNSDIHDVNGYPMNGVALTRNVTVEHVYGHGTNDPGLLINTKFDDVSTGITPVGELEGHVDGISWGMNGDANSIAYGVTFTNLKNSLGFISYYGMSNFALVNVNISTTGTGPGGQSQFDRQNTGVYNHVYLDNVVLTDQSLYFDDRGGGQSQWSNVTVKNSKAILFSLPGTSQLLNNTLMNNTPIPDRY